MVRVAIKPDPIEPGRVWVVETALSRDYGAKIRIVKTGNGPEPTSVKTRNPTHPEPQ